MDGVPPKEEDLSWTDFSAIRDISSDGKLLLFDESGEAGGLFGAIYLRKMDGSAPVRLSDGNSNLLSADSKRVMGLTGADLNNLKFNSKPRVLNVLAPPLPFNGEKR